jgi:hypothetical protein
LFEDIFGALHSECGFTPTQVREMTLHDVQRLTNHWRRSPPLRILVACCAAALGVKLPEMGAPDKSNHLNADEFAALVRATDGGRVLMNGGSGG